MVVQSRIHIHKIPLYQIIQLLSFNCYLPLFLAPGTCSQPCWRRVCYKESTVYENATESFPYIANSLEQTILCL